MRSFIACCNLVYLKLNADDKLLFMELIKIRLCGDAADLVNGQTMVDMDRLEELTRSDGRIETSSAETS